MERETILKEFYNKRFVMDEDERVLYVKWRSVVLHEGFKAFCIIIDGNRIYFDEEDGFVDKRVINITDLSLRIYAGGITVVFPLKNIDYFKILFKGDADY